MTQFPMTREFLSPTARIDARSSRRIRSLGFGGSLVLGCWVLVILFIPSSLSAAPLLSTNLPPVSPALPEASFSVIRVFGALMLVLGLFLGGVWLFKNWQRLTIQRGRPSQLQIVEMKALGGKQVLYVVGYQQQRMLLASSPSGVTLVSHLPNADAPELQPEAVTGQNFVQALQQAVQGKP